MSTDKFALITGGGLGIGKASALALARAGWNVALAGRRLDPLAAAAREIEALGRRSFAHSCDVGDPDAVAALFAAVEKEFGRLDLLFNNAGVSAPGVPMEELTYAQWKTVVDANLTGAFLCAQGAIRLMKRQTPARRAHHQQRLDLRACAAPQQRALHRDQTRDHGPDEIDRARLSPVRHRLRADRHRQRADRNGVPDDDGRAAGRRPHRDRTDHRPQRGRRRGRAHGEPAALDQHPDHDDHGDQDAVRGTGVKGMSAGRPELRKSTWGT